MRIVRRSGKARFSRGHGPGAPGGPRRRGSTGTMQTTPCMAMEACVAESPRALCPLRGAWTCQRPAGLWHPRRTRPPSTAAFTSRMGHPAWWLSRRASPSKTSCLDFVSGMASTGRPRTSSWWAGTSLWCCTKTVASWSQGTCA
uniref:Macaca fascicularis brain cDNA clone: QflA-16423, similar to human regulator of G-protein signalling 12 (RGS12), transcriptvariant 3, mRNA, RefSeq: NM_198227.1 n=1 Tax=Macaca fascicularis TaxID=9541 RepID=I7G510_MACFA|nr:unnamed protein product [Macaca fascicularis]